MTDANLSIRVTSTGAEQAAKSLDQLAAEAKQAEAAAEALRIQMDHLTASERRASDVASQYRAAMIQSAAANRALKDTIRSSNQIIYRQGYLIRQYNDIGVSLASGQSPLLVLTQQGAQFVDLYAGGGGWKAAMEDLRLQTRGLVTLFTRFAPYLAAAGVAAGAAYLAYQRLAERARELAEAQEEAEEATRKLKDSLVDLNRYVDADHIYVAADAVYDFNEALRQAAERTDNAELRSFASDYISVAENAEEASERVRALTAQAVELQARIDRQRTSGGGSILSGYSLEDQRRLEETQRLIESGSMALEEYRAQIRLIYADLPAGLAQSVEEAIQSNRFEDAIQMLENAFTGTTDEFGNKIKETIDEAAEAAREAQEQLADMVASYTERRLSAEGNVIDLMEYRFERERQEILRTYADSEQRTRALHELELAQNSELAQQRRRLDEENSRERFRQMEAEKAKREELMRAEFDALTQAKMKSDDLSIARSGASQAGRDFDISLGVYSGEQIIGMQGDDQLAEAQRLRDQELALYIEDQNERERILQEYANREIEIRRQTEDAIRNYRREQEMNMIGATSEFFGAMGNLAEAFGDRQNDAAKALFAVQQGLNLAMALMNAYTAYTQAWADPTLTYYQKVFASVQALTTVLGAVAQISSVRISGARELGGPVSAGQTYLVGERGPELFTAGTSGQITSNANLQRAMNDNSSGTSQPQKVVVQLMLSDDLKGQIASTNNKLIEVEAVAISAPQRAKADMIRDVQRGGPMGDAFERTYGMNRGFGS